MQNTKTAPESLFAVRGDRRNGIDRLSMLGELSRSTVPLLERELDDVAHAGGAVVLDLGALESVDASGVRALGRDGARRGSRPMAVVHRQLWRSCPRCVRESRAGALLSVTDVSDVLASGAGEWSPISLTRVPRQRTSRASQLAKERR